MRYLLMISILIVVLATAQGGPRGKKRRPPGIDESKFNRSDDVRNCSHPWFNQTLEEFNSTFGFIPPMAKFRKFWEFLKKYFNESFDDFNGTFPFPPRKYFPRHGRKGGKPWKGNRFNQTWVTQAPPNNFVDHGDADGADEDDNDGGDNDANVAVTQSPLKRKPYDRSQKSPQNFRSGAGGGGETGIA